MTTLYIAGRMSGDPDYAQKFRAAAADLREQGIDVVSPVELDEADGQQPKQVEPGGPEWCAFLARDLQIIARPDVDGVVVLPDWRESRGATLEVHVARELGKVVLAYPTLKPVTTLDPCRSVDPCNRPDCCGGSAAKEQRTCARQVASGGPSPCFYCVDCLPEQTNANTIRTFATGATRDTDEGKADYEGYLHPRVLRAYGRYMLRHSIQSDGSRRPSDNWQKGIPADAYMQSAFRHFLDWWTIHRGHGAAESVECDAEEAICALLFNAMGYLSVLLAAEPTAEDSALSGGDTQDIPRTPLYPTD